MSDHDPIGPLEPGGGESFATKEPSIGDRLRQARERRGLTITEVSAILKVRAPILEAFEREDHSNLPPRVYALGQLRTYAAFLGLDPASVVAGWQSAPTTSEATPIPLSPKTTARNRLVNVHPSFVRSSRGLLALGGVGLVVLAISAFMGLQILRFILPPSIAITYPVEAVSNLAAGTLTHEIKGTADARASIIVSTSAGTRITTIADASGLWRITIPLGSGSTEVIARAIKPGTGGESSTSEERVFVVALPDKESPEITVTQPTANLVIENGDVPVSILTNPNSMVEITATDGLGEMLTSTLTSDAAGTASGRIALPTGRWTISFSVANAEGELSQATRAVEVSFSGVTVTVTGGPFATWIRVWVDGQSDPSVGVSGRTVTPGTRLTFTGTKRIDVRSGDPSVLLFTLNGRTIDALGNGTGAQTYAFLDTGKVQESSRR